MHNVETRSQTLIPVFPKAVAKNAPLTEQHVYNFEYTAVNTNPASKIYALGVTRLSKDGLTNKNILKLFNLDKKEQIFSCIFGSKIVSISFSSDSRYLTVLTDEQLISIWELKQEKMIINAKLSSLFPSDVSLRFVQHTFCKSDDDSYMIVALSQNTVRFMSFLPEYAQPLKGISSKNPHFPDFSSFDVLPGNILAIGCVDGSVFTIDSRDIKVPFTVAETIKEKCRVSAFLNNAVILSTDSEQIVASFSPHEEVSELFRVSLQKEVDILAVVTSLSGKLAAAVTKDGEIVYAKFQRGIQAGKSKLWEGLQSFHQSPIKMIAFEKQKGLYASYDESKRLNIWDIASNHVVLSRVMEKEISHISFHPTGQFFLLVDSAQVALMLVSTQGIYAIKSVSANFQGGAFNYGGSLIMAYNQTRISLYSIYESMKEVSFMNSRKQIKNVTWCDKDNFKVYIRYEDSSDEIRSICPKNGSYIMQPVVKSTETIGTQSDSPQNCKNALLKQAEKQDSEGHYLHARDINGVKSTIESGFITYGADGSIMIFNTPKIVPFYAKKNIMFDEILVSPKDIRNTETMAEAIVLGISENRMKSKEILHSVDGKYAKITNDLMAAFESEVTRAQENMRSLQESLSNQMQIHMETKNDIVAQKEQRIQDRKLEHENHLREIAVAQATALEQQNKTDVSMKKTKEKILDRQKMAMDYMINDFTQKKNQAVQDISNLTRSLAIGEDKYQEFQHDISEELEKEIQDLNMEYQAVIQKQIKTNADLVVIQKSVKQEFMKVQEYARKDAMTLQEQQEIIFRLTQDIENSSEFVGKLKNSIVGRFDIMREKEALLKEAEKNLEAYDRTCFLLQSQLKSEEEKVKPREEYLVEQRSHQEKMKEEIAYVQNIRYQLERKVGNLQRQRKAIQHEVERVDLQIQRVKGTLQQVRQDLYPLSACTNAKEEMAVMRNIALKYQTEKQKTEQKDAVELLNHEVGDFYKRIKETDAQRLMAQQKSLKTKDNLNKQRVFLMQEMADLKRLLTYLK